MTKRPQSKAQAQRDAKDVKERVGMEVGAQEPEVKHGIMIPPMPTPEELASGEHHGISPIHGRSNSDFLPERRPTPTITTAELEQRVLDQAAAARAAAEAKPELDEGTLAHLYRYAKDTCQVWDCGYPSIACATFNCRKTTGKKYFIGRKDGPMALVMVLCEDCLRQMLASLPEKYMMELVKAKGLALVESGYADGMESTVDILTNQVESLTERIKAQAAKIAELLKGGVVDEG